MRITRRTPHRFALLAPAVVVGLLASGCGGGGKSKPSPTPSAPAAPSAAIQQVTRNWEMFFSKDTPVPQKMSLLEKGQTMQAAVTAFAHDPRTSQTTAKVTSVQPFGTTATVHYQVLVNDKVMLPNAVGKAVLEDNTWKVSDATLCGLLGLAATPGKKIPGCAS